MKKRIAILLCLATGPAFGQVGSSKTVAQLNTEINTLWPDNTTGQITPFNSRQTLLDLVASYANLLALGSVTNAMLANMPRNSVKCNNTVLAGPPLDCITVDFGETNPNNSVGVLNVAQAFAAPFDSALWALGFARVGTTLSLPGGGVAGSANQFGFMVQVNIPATGSAATYEKGAAMFECVTVDPSAPGIPRGCIGTESRGMILSTNATGQAWGGLDNARIFPGGIGDGLLVGREIDVLNEGTDQPAINTTTSKYGLLIVNQGSVASTAAMLIEATPGLWHRGLVAASASFVAPGVDPNASFIELLGAAGTLFNVRTDGIVIQNVPLNGSINFLQTTNNGISAHVFGSNPAVGNNTDEVDLAVNFRTNTGTAYTGGSLDFNQADATNAAPVTTFTINLVTGARVATHIISATINNAGTAGEWAPVTDNIMSLGDTTHMYSGTFNYFNVLKSQAFGSLPGCDAAHSGWVAFVNNSNTKVNNAAANGAGGLQVLVVCASTQWTVMGGN